MMILNAKNTFRVGRSLFQLKAVSFRAFAYLWTKCALDHVGRTGWKCGTFKGRWVNTSETPCTPCYPHLLKPLPPFTYDRYPEPSLYLNCCNQVMPARRKPWYSLPFPPIAVQAQFVGSFVNRLFYRQLTYGGCQKNLEIDVVYEVFCCCFCAKPLVFEFILSCPQGELGVGSGNNCLHFKNRSYLKVWRVPACLLSRKTLKRPC